MNTTYATNIIAQSYKRTTISLDGSVYQRLRKKGRFGESFSELLSRLLDIIDKEKIE